MSKRYLMNPQPNPAGSNQNGLKTANMKPGKFIHHDDGTSTFIPDESAEPDETFEHMLTVFASMIEDAVNKNDDNARRQEAFDYANDWLRNSFHVQAEADGLDGILTTFLVQTLGNKAVVASPEFARKYAKAALQALSDWRTAAVLEKLKQYENPYYMHITGMDGHYKTIRAVPSSVIDETITKLNQEGQ